MAGGSGISASFCWSFNRIALRLIEHGGPRSQVKSVFKSEWRNVETVETGSREILIRECIDRVLELEEDVELVEADLSGSSRSGLLRVYIYTHAGVTVEDCTRISRRLSREIDHEEELLGSLSIEVSSPGLDRKLQTRRDFEMAIGEVLKLKIEEDGGSRAVIGRLTEVGEDSLLLDPPPAESGSTKKKNENEPKRISLSSVLEGSIEVLM